MVRKQLVFHVSLKVLLPVMSVQHRYVRFHLTDAAVLVNLHYLHLALLSKSFPANDHSTYFFFFLIQRSSHQTIHPVPNVNINKLHLLKIGPLLTEKLIFLAHYMTT